MRAALRGGFAFVALRGALARPNRASAPFTRSEAAQDVVIHFNAKSREIVDLDPPILLLHRPIGSPDATT